MVEGEIKSPFALFAEWFSAAQISEPSLAEAMTLATAAKNGIPSARMVLLKSFGEDGFVFYTNLRVKKV